MNTAPRLWVVDAGNSHIKAARFENDTIVDLVRVPRDKAGTVPEEWAALARRHSPADGIACALARPADGIALRPFIASLPTHSEPFFVRPEGPLPFRFVYTSGAPGADRLANAAALGSLSPGRAAIVVDFGTATHVEVVDAKGDFAGGIIIPGIRLQFDILSPATAGRLPQLAVDGAAPRVLSNSTDGAIRSGILLGMAGAVERFVAEARRELNDAAAPVYTTGGGAAMMEPLLSFAHTPDPELTFKGIAAVWRKVAGASRR